MQQLEKDTRLVSSHFPSSGDTRISCSMCCALDITPSALSPSSHSCCIQHATSTMEGAQSESLKIHVPPQQPGTVCAERPLALLEEAQDEEPGQRFPDTFRLSWRWLGRSRGLIHFWLRL
eukprot:TRINITY_DN12629_c0_g1_i1.p2 TRINITY_DN12629_c0_g1~~TRINITY_DN12629_c0_g1_i1.p2  ORF type:complete len:120 (+),score=9.08 TRINITY_DN12629_c0_g1_i1:276-635(+)